VDLSAMIAGPVRLERQPDPIADVVADLVRRFDPGGYVLTCPVAGCGWELLVPRMELDPTPLDVDLDGSGYTVYVEGVPREAVEDELAGHIDWHASTCETDTEPPEDEEAPCPDCGHQLLHHHPMDGCGACAMAMTGACHPRRLWA
jgi:hypothetical protein